MANTPSGFHYFVHEGQNRQEKIESWVVHTLLSSAVPQSKRESSVPWELKHSSSVAQFAKLLAQKRGLNEELAVVAAVLHDVHVIVEGGYTNHARLGAAIAERLLEKMGTFTKNEIGVITSAIAQHSDKHTYSNDPLVELIKDADTLDCFFYGDTVYDYKAREHLIHYYKRVVSLRTELRLPERPYFKEQLRRLC